jgi:U3 small nucleolar RNA-associated protein 21
VGCFPPEFFWVTDAHKNIGHPLLAMPSSNLFVPYKATGLVCDGVQLHLQNLGKESFLTTSIGRAFQVYNTDKLGISIVSRQLDHDIS